MAPLLLYYSFDLQRSQAKDVKMLKSFLAVTLTQTYGPTNCRAVRTARFSVTTLSIDAVKRGRHGDKVDCRR